MNPTLEGIRVLSFTRGLAGPLAGRYLAEAGADVIKVESVHGGMDSFRQFTTGHDPDGSARYVEYNLGVRSVRLNLRHETGRRLARELVGKVDVLLDNFRPDVLDRLGLGAERLLQDHPELIVVKTPGFGCSGPRSQEGSWGPNVMAYCGATHLWNHPGAPQPVGTQSAYPDYLAGAFVPAAVAAALLRRRKTRKGAFIDVAQAELLAYVFGVTALERSVTGAEPEPVGNASAHAAPHGCYPCRGEDRWCAVAVETDEQWRQLVRAIGQAGLAENARYDSLEKRRARRDEIDGVITAYTSTREASQIMRTFQDSGVPCGVVQDARDVSRDPQLRSRGLFVEVDHPVVGRTTVPGSPVHISKGGMGKPRRSPLLGEHDEEIICGLLGHTGEQLKEWQSLGVVE